MAYDPSYKEYLLWREQQRRAGTLLKPLPKSPQQSAGAWPLNINRGHGLLDEIDIAVNRFESQSENEFLNLMYSDKSIRSASVEEILEPVPNKVFGSAPRKTLSDYRKETTTFIKNKWKGLRPYQKIGVGIGVGVGLMGLAFSAKDDNYNDIEGLHPGSNGLGASVIRGMTDFGSGYKGLPESLMGVSLNKDILKYRADIISDKEAYREVLARIKEKEANLKEDVGDFENYELQRVSLRHPGIINNLNIANQKLRQIDLSNFKVNVEDADTLILKRRGLFNVFDNPIQIRLAGIDAPEVGSHEADPLEEVRYKQEQPYGKKATRVLEDLIQNQKNLSLVVGGEKTYGRYVGALIGDNSILNVDLARQGAVSSLPFGDVFKDVVSRGAVAKAERQAQAEESGIWGMARYKVIQKVREKTEQSITYNTLTRIDKLAQNLSLGAYSSLLESMGSEERQLTREEQISARRIGYTLRKTHGPKKRAYNKFDGLHPGSEGIGAWSMRSHSDFGSGWQGLSKLFDKKDVVTYGYESYEEKEQKRQKRSANRINAILGKDIKLTEENTSTKKGLFIGAIDTIIKKLGNGQKFSAMPNSGTMAASTRGQLTEFKEDFASRWDKFRHLAVDIMDGTENLAFRKARKEAKEISILGEGMFGRVALMEGTYKGEKFKFARKTGDFGEEEVQAQIAASFKHAPSVYGYGQDKAGKYMDIELFEGKALAELNESELNLIRKEAETAISNVHQTGYTHGDVHLGNIFLIEKEGKRDIGIIDFGNAQKITSNDQIKKDISSFQGYISNRIEGLKKPAEETIQHVTQYNDPFAAAQEQSLQSVDPFAVQFDQQQALKRMDRFNKVSKQAVGAGLKSSHNASKKHKGFNSTSGSF